MRLLILCLAAALSLLADNVKAVRVFAAAGEGPVRTQQPIRIAVNLAEAGGLKPILPSVWIDEWPSGAAINEEACTARARSLQAANTRLRQATRDLNVYYLVTISATGLLQVTDPRTGFGGSRLITAIDFQAEPLAWAQDPTARLLLLALAGRSQLVVIDTVTWREQKSWDAGGEIAALFHDPSRAAVWTLTKTGVWKRFTISSATGTTVALPAPGTLAFSGDGVAMLSSAGSSWLLREGAQPLLLPRRTARSTVWSAAADAFVSLTPEGSVEMWSTSGELISAIPSAPYPAGHDLRLTEDGRFALIWTPGRNHVRLADLSKRGWRGELLVDRPVEIFAARDFVYVRSAASAENLVVPMDSIRGTTNLQGRKVAGGTAPSAASRFASVATLSGADIVFWTAPTDDQVFAYHPGMNAASGGLKVTGKPVGLLLAGPPLVEVKPGEFTAEFTLPRPGSYVAVASSSQPKRQECVVFRVEGEAAPKPSRYRVSVAPQEIRAGLEHSLNLQLEGEPVPSRLRLLVLSVDGQWQNRYWAEVKPGGSMAVPLSLPRPGQYWLTFEIPGEALSHQKFSRLALEVLP